jgi:DegV family protein with EDD domain
VTDSAASLPTSLAAANGVTVVPMWVTIGGEQSRDTELDMAEVLARLGEGLTTSGPAPGELVDAASQADQGDGVVILTISRRMSSSYDAARLAAGLLAEQGPGKDAGEERVAVVDTGTAAGAEGLVVLAASRAARAGLGLDGVVAAAERAARRARLLATLPSLEHLARGGRVPGIAALGARWLGLQPVFEFRQGKVKPLRPARGRRLACQRIVTMWASDLDEQLRRGSALHICALHALEPEIAEDLLSQVQAYVKPATAFVGSFSPVMVAHTGPGLVGLAWWWEDESPEVPQGSARSGEPDALSGSGSG